MYDDATRPWWRTPSGVAILGFVLVGAFYLLREHYGHVLGALPYLLLLGCPLMHLLMHRGHGQGHSGHHDPRTKGEREDRTGRTP